MAEPRSWLFVPADSESKSRPNAGIVTWAHRSFNQRNELVCECTRTALLLKKSNG